MSGCIIEFFSSDGFDSKEQVINAIKENIENLEVFNNEITNKFKTFDIIENSLFKTYHTSKEYKTQLSEKMFKNMKLKDISIIYDDKRIKYSTRNKFGTHCGFYYSFDDDKNYIGFSEDTMKELKEKGMYLEFGDRTALIDLRGGWYTEKVCDNWYFYEQDYDNYNFMKYIYDDINNMNPPSKYYENNWYQFDRYNPYKQKVAFRFIQEKDGFNTKEEIIDAFKTNAKKIDMLTKEIAEKIEVKSIIKNSVRIQQNSVKYKTELLEEVFSKLKIDYISFDIDKRIRYVVKNRFGYELGFYYSINDDKNYYIYSDNLLQLSKKDGTYLEFDSKTVMFGSRYGWYTEKLCDNWFFYEEDFDNLNFFKYIYDDISNMNPANMYYEKHKAQIERYNPHLLDDKWN